jgi:iron complex outermembrane recepter protein
VLRRILLAFFLVCITVASAMGQEAVRETVVVTAAATPVTLGSVTRTLTIITREQIAQLPVHTVADVLRLAASVDVRARGERGVQTDFAIRGAHFGQMLMLLDGVRLNDAQSGHHNGDVPVPLDAIERIEILHGPGSSLFGADAFGGTINVITRRGTAPAAVAVQAGSFGLVAARGQVSGQRGALRQTLSASADRSDGFMFERGFESASVSARTAIGERSGVALSYVWKDFGANGFYGNAPSHEWTNQTLVAADHRFTPRGKWQLGVEASYRTHGDRFLFNVLRPGVSESRHRTHAVIGTVKATRPVRVRSTLTVGGEGGGDWIRSSNLGDHTTSRASGFGEWRYAASPRTQVDASVRIDRYSEFGTSWSPSAGVGFWLSPAMRLRGSAARAFRVPTFTERYYRDPANMARAEVQPETAWAGDAGVDLYLRSGLVLSATLFARFEEDVIDWLRPTTADVWRTYNIRDVDSSGVEVSLRRPFTRGAFVQVGYTGIDLRANEVTQLSKYVLDYAPHSFTGAGVGAAACRISAGATRRVQAPDALHRQRHLHPPRCQAGPPFWRVRGVCRRHQPAERVVPGDRARADAGARPIRVLLHHRQVTDDQAVCRRLRPLSCHRGCRPGRADGSAERVDSRRVERGEVGRVLSRCRRLQGGPDHGSRR